ncbi:MAG: bifunctional DNA-formamidopyrimidine glycosylase/DNA-(apurinic or apyrimidinic site) lyase [Desulfobacterales bacterium]|nr:bifunctional DNA-formamidopyrimidine glycosylase/DNA-(apurinic or apyrimidinic site) lyase [Desulfobacterales bacterium]
MPELPEVQTVVADLKAAGFEGAVITRADIFWPKTIYGLSAAAFQKRIKGLTIAAIRRRGKFIVFDFRNGGHLLIHLRMSGRLLIKTTGLPRLKHEHVILNFKDRQMRFHDTRKFGRFYLVKDANPILGRLGPEPLDPSFRAAGFVDMLRNRGRMIKPLLLDQSFIAGLGNIYVDEALWDAGIHPQKIAAELDAREAKSLYHTIRKVLRRGLKNLGTTLGSGQTNFFSITGHTGRNREQLKVFRRNGLACPRCRMVIKRIIVGQRSTHVCERCQKI